MHEPLKLIQVGVGGWGATWADLVDRSQFWEAAAYVDVDEASLKQAAGQFGVDDRRCFTELGAALNEIEADGVLCIVPPEVHADVTMQALEAGRHVLVEKPLADNMRSAVAMVDTAREQDRILMVSQNYRFKRAPRTVRRVLERGIVGKPGYVFVNFHKAPRFTTQYRLEMAEPLLRDMSIHHFDQMRYVLNANPVSVYARTWNPTWSWFKGNPSVALIIEMERGVQISYVGSWVSQGFETTWDGDWRIECAGGEIHWANNQVAAKPSEIYYSVFNEQMLEKRGWMVAELEEMPVEERSYSLLEFYNSITEQRQPETSGIDNLNSLALTMAAVESAREGQLMRISDVLPERLGTTG